MEEEIEVIDLTPELFIRFDWDDLGADPDRAAYFISVSDFEFIGFPNDIVFNSDPVFVVDKKGNGLTAYYLSAMPEGEDDARLLLGLTDPLSVFTVNKSEIKAMHPIAGNFQISNVALDAFGKAGLINQNASFSVGQEWRPWHGYTQ